MQSAIFTITLEISSLYFFLTYDGPPTRMGPAAPPAPPIVPLL